MDHKQYKSLKLKQKPSSTFSSTLLDTIYRSIDDIDGGGGGLAGENMVVYRETKKQSCSGFEYHDEDIAKHRRARLIEKWMEKKDITQTEKIVLRRRSVPEFDRNSWGLTHSSSSSSDSSSGGGFSSSETDSIYGFPPMKPKPVRTTAAAATAVTAAVSKTEEFQKQRKSKKTHDNNQDKKSKTAAAMKIFNEIKKAKKQPISPGGRLAGFLNSLFTTNKSKSDMITAATTTESKSGHASTCSSASSFSRSCLSTGSSKTAKRSVRFNVEDDYQPYSRQKTLNIPKISIKNEVKIQMMEKIYHHHHHDKMSYEDVEMGIQDHHDEEDDDDAASYASSDLFELDNLSVIGNGIDRYCKELPVYETTHVHTNRAIANGLIP